MPYIIDPSIISGARLRRAVKRRSRALWIISGAVVAAVSCSFDIRISLAIIFVLFAYLLFLWTAIWFEIAGVVNPVVTYLPQEWDAESSEAGAFTITFFDPESGLEVKSITVKGNDILDVNEKGEYFFLFLKPGTLGDKSQGEEILAAPADQLPTLFKNKLLDHEF